MDPREFELIAIGHVLARYRATGTLPNINGEPFDLAKFKSHLSAGIDTDTDTDIDIAIIQNTIVDDDCEHDKTEPSATVAEPEQPKPESVTATEQEQPKQEPTEQKEEPTQESINPMFGGKLFQFFNRDGK